MARVLYPRGQCEDTPRVTNYGRNPGVSQDDCRRRRSCFHKSIQMYVSDEVQLLCLTLISMIVEMKQSIVRHDDMHLGPHSGREGISITRDPKK